MSAYGVSARRRRNGALVPRRVAPSRRRRSPAAASPRAWRRLAPPAPSAPPSTPLPCASPRSVSAQRKTSRASIAREAAGSLDEAGAASSSAGLLRARPRQPVDHLGRALGVLAHRHLVVLDRGVLRQQLLRDIRPHLVA